MKKSEEELIRESVPKLKKDRSVYLKRTAC